MIAFPIGTRTFFLYLILLTINAYGIAQTCDNGDYQFSDIVVIYTNAGCMDCHGSSGGLDLSDYTNVINGGNRGAGGCGPYANPLAYLQGKVNGTIRSSDNCGQPMPPSSGVGEKGMSDAAIEAVQSWIDNGAPEFCPIVCYLNGTPCDDENECTINDKEDGNCNCVGTFQDSDNDGICDANDTSIGNCTLGGSCDDMDVCTTNDVYDANCNCAGTFQDSDNDEICDANDSSTGDCTLGESCDDTDECTLNDMYDANCNCAGTFQDIDNDGICDTNDTTFGDCILGASCDDTDACTTNDVYTFNCECAGTFQDSDNDGVCDVNDTTTGDCMVGENCDDTDACTTNDVYGANCNCAGTFQDSDNDGTCDANDATIGDCMIGASCDDTDVCTTNDVYDANCNCAGTFQDSDNDGICDANDPPIGDVIDNFSGNISSATITNLSSITISAGGQEIAVDTNGFFSIQDLSIGNGIEIIPNKNDEFLNGVSTFDIVLLNRHILGMTPLDSPYKLIAADVNRSNTITVFDMVLIQQLILGINTDFPNNTSYRFIPADFQFEDPIDPFDFPESILLDSTSDTLVNLSCIAIKTGDVSYDVGETFSTSQIRSSPPVINLEVANLTFKSGTDIDVFIPIPSTIIGYQMEIKYDPNYLTFQEVALDSENLFNYHLIRKGRLLLSWIASPQNTTLNQSSLIIPFSTKNDGVLNQVFEIGNSYLSSEAYSKNTTIHAIQFNFKETIKEVQNPITLYPNPTKNKLKIIGEGMQRIQVYDVHGGLLWTEQMGSTKNEWDLFLDNQPNGIYWLQIEGKDYEVMKKIIRIGERN